MSKKQFAKKIIPLIIIAVLLYTIAAFVLQFYAGVEISPTLTTCYFGFWGVELSALTIIKVNKIKKKDEE